MKGLRRPGWALIGVGALFVVMAVINVWWVGRFRLGNPLDIDEAGYMSAAFDDSTALLRHGLAGLVHAYRTPSQFGPLVPLMTVPVHLLMGRDVYAGLYVELPFLLLLLVASYGLGARLAGPKAGLLTAIVVAGLPAVIDFSRSYQFVLPTAAAFVLALYALLRSDGGRDRAWSLAWGALLGMAVLSRLVILAFVPGFVVAVLFLGLQGRDGRRRRISNGALATLVALGIAATWYAKNLGVTLHYLLLYGYGAKATDYGPPAAPLTIDFWTRRLTDSIDQFIYVPMAALLAVGLALGLWRLHRPGSLAGSRVAREAGALAIVYGAGYLALTSTSNQGTGFAVPLVPILVAIAVGAIVRMRSRRGRLALSAALLSVSAFNVASKADVVPDLSKTIQVAGRTVADGRGALQRYVAAARYPLLGSTQPLPVLQGKWLPAAHRLATIVEGHSAAHGIAPILCFASRDPLLNTNTFELEARFRDQRVIPVAQMDSRLEGDTVAAYRDALADPLRGQPNYLLTADPAPGEFRGRVTQAYAESAARQLGFVQIAAWRLPDERQARLWWRDVPLPRP